MRTFNQWMSEYAVSHQNPVNKKIHKICVPAIMLSIIGLFWAIPTPEFFQQVPYVNWATLFVVGCLGFYFSLNFLMFIGMLIQSTVMVLIVQKINEAGVLIPASVGIFIVAWIFQFYGHKIEGKKPSFLQDLAFLLIGPLWVQKALYDKLGIKV